MKNHKKLFKIAKYILFITLGTLIVAATVIVSCRLIVKSTSYKLYYQGELTEAENYDYIVVPGAGIYYDKPETYLEDRLDTALILYESGVSTKIIVSGGFDDVSQLYESAVMKLYLEKRGVPTENIICDNYGTDTAETIRRAKEYVGEKRVIICTQSLYAPRTGFLAKQFGLNATFADSDIKIYTTGMGKSRLRETFAATKAVFEGIFQKKSRFDLTRYPFTIGDNANE